MSVRAYTFFFFAVYFVPFALYGQYPSQGNSFTINERKGCAPFSFTLSHPGCASQLCFADYGDGRTAAVNNGDVLTYPAAGNFSLKIVTQSSTLDEIQIIVTQSIQPAFEIYSCNGGSVQVKITDQLYPNYIIDFDDGPEQTFPQGLTPHDHTYPGPLPPSKTVTVRGRHTDVADLGGDINATDNCPATSQPVMVTAALPATTIDKVTVLNSTSIEIDHSASPSIQYNLMAAKDNGTLLLLKKIYNPSPTLETLTSNVLPDNSFYCFRIDTNSPCGGTGTNIVANSNIVCSIKFDAKAQNNQNALTWFTSVTGSPTFSLTRDGAPVTLASPATKNYTDTDVICNTPYDYQITAQFGIATSVSLTKNVTAISTNIPAAVSDISAIVDGQQMVMLEWQQPPGFTAASYAVNKSGNGISLLLGNTTTPDINDNAYVAGTCYTVDYKDACGNSSPVSIQACPIVLSGSLQNDIANPNTINLSWTGYTGWKNGVDHYEVFVNGNFYELTNTTSLVIPDDHLGQINIYTVVAVADPSAAPPITTSVSNAIEIIKLPNLYYPTAFSPESSLVDNKKFKVFSQYTEHFELKIFNRWGELMFITDDLNSDGWDGTYKGTPMPEGTYVFTAKIKDFTGRTFDRSGTILLLRKN